MSATYSRHRITTQRQVPLPSLPKRQLQVAAGLAWGLSVDQIAIWLGVHSGTARTHLARLCATLGLSSLKELERWSWANESALTQITLEPGDERPKVENLPPIEKSQSRDHAGKSKPAYMPSLEDIAAQCAAIRSGKVCV